MRHFYGVLLGVLLAAAVFFGAAWGYIFATRGEETSAAANGSPMVANGGLPAGGGALFSNSHVMLGGGALLAVGLAAGLLMVIPWVSPLAAGLPGLVLVAWTALYVSNVAEALKLIPLKNRDFGLGFESLLFSGLLGAAGLAMITPLFIPSRWRRRAQARDYAAPGPGLLEPPSADAGEPAGRDGWDHYPTITDIQPMQRSQPPWGAPDEG
jgi:hypothetical protein